MPIRTAEWLSQALCVVLPSAAQAEALTPLLRTPPSSLPAVRPFPTSQTPLACASPSPGEVFSFHRVPPQSLPTPRGMLTPPLPLSRKPCAGLHITHYSQVTSMCPCSPGQELPEGPFCFLVSSLTSKKPGLTWASSQYLRTSCTDQYKHRKPRKRVTGPHGPMH